MKSKVLTESKDPLHEADGLYTGETIKTFTGKYINVFNPKPESIDIEDIAHALSYVCRFAGHTRYFYSVAQHSVEVMKMVKRENRLAALLHDATEAYMCDLPRPIKSRMNEYKKVEETLMRVIAERFEVAYPFDSEIKVADNFQLVKEFNYLMRKEWNPEDHIEILSQTDSKMLFLSCYKTLA